MLNPLIYKYYKQYKQHKQTEINKTMTVKEYNNLKDKYETEVDNMTPEEIEENRLQCQGIHIALEINDILNLSLKYDTMILDILNEKSTTPTCFILEQENISNE